MKTVQMLCITAVLLLLTGCGSSGDGRTETPIPSAYLPAASESAPRTLVHCSNYLDPSVQTFATFTLEQDTTFAYAFYNGTVEIFNAQGDVVHSNIFFPVGNALNAFSLAAGTYTAKLQGSLPERTFAAFYTDAAPLVCATVDADTDYSVSPGENAFIRLTLASAANVGLQTSRGYLALYGTDFSALAEAQRSISKTLSAGNYLILVTNPESASGTLSITIK